MTSSTIPALSQRSGQFGCNVCGSRWSGANVSHCGACHETFGGLTAFEKHRVGSIDNYDPSKDTRRCEPPANIKSLVITARGTWGTDAGDVDFIEIHGGAS